MKIVPNTHGGRAATDAALFQAIAAGDLGQLGVLFDRHHEVVRLFLYRSTRRSPDVDDLVQETFLAAARAAGSYDGREVARPFLIGVAAQLVRRRRRTLARLYGLVDAFARVPASRAATPEDSLGDAEASARLHAAIDELTEDRRLVLLMIEWQGMSGAEVATALGVPIGTVWRRLHEARRALLHALHRGER